MTDYLTREAILETDDRQIEEVPVPEWHGVVRVRGMSAKERDAFEASMLTPAERGKDRQVSLDNARAKLVVRCAVNGDGGPLFTEQDVAALGEKSGAALARIAQVAQRLSGLTADDLDELAKNSGSG